MTEDLSLFANMFGMDFGLGGALTLVLLAGVSCVIVTRDTRKLRLLLFPMMLGFSRLGIGAYSASTIVILILAGVLWATTLFGARMFTDALSGISDTAGSIFTNSRFAERQTAWQGLKKAEKTARIKATEALIKDESFSAMKEGKKAYAKTLLPRTHLVKGADGKTHLTIERKKEFAFPMMMENEKREAKKKQKELIDAEHAKFQSKKLWKERQKESQTPVTDMFRENYDKKKLKKILKVNTWR